VSLEVVRADPDRARQVGPADQRRDDVEVALVRRHVLAALGELEDPGWPQNL